MPGPQFRSEWQSPQWLGILVFQGSFTRLARWCFERATLRKLLSSLVAAAVLAVGASSTNAIALSFPGPIAAHLTRAVQPAIGTAIVSGAVEDGDLKLPAQSAPSRAFSLATPSIVPAPHYSPGARGSHSDGCIDVARWCLGHATATAET